MGQRNMLSTHQMLDLESGGAFSHLHLDDHVISSDMFACADHMRPLPSGPGNSSDLGLGQFRGHHDQSTYYRNQYNNIQSHHHVPNYEFVGVSLPSFYNPYMISPTSSRVFPVSQNSGSIVHLPSSINNTSIGINTDECYGRDNLFSDDVRGSCKRKNAEVVPGNHSNVNGLSSSSLSSSYQFGYSGQPQWNGVAFTPPECRGDGILPIIEGSHTSVRSRSGAISLQPESSVVHHYNYVHQGNNMGHSYQPVNNAWIVQSENSAGDGGGPGWNNTHAMNYMHGRCLSSGSVEVANMGMQSFQHSSPSTSSAFILHPASMPNFHCHLAPGQNMQIHNYNHHAQIPSPYQHPCNNSHRNNANASSTGLDSNSRFPIFPSSAEMIFRPPRLQPQPALDVGHGDPRILSSQDAALLELTRFYGVENLVDQHRDMRLDIDDMSYEELLALEEQIGDVNIGLTEQLIIKNLKTTLYDPLMKSLQLDHSYPENETCAICQVEYMENERIGTLDCGHWYHVDCIKQWLLVKNLCPICKKSALAVNRRDG